jgi:uncharacterized protein YjbJ (UPF0337 family)
VSGTRNKVAGAIEYLRGKMERLVGKHTGNRSAQIKGTGRQARGGARYGVGKAEDKLS